MPYTPVRTLALAIAIAHHPACTAQESVSTSEAKGAYRRRPPRYGRNGIPQVESDTVVLQCYSVHSADFSWSQSTHHTVAPQTHAINRSWRRERWTHRRQQEEVLIREIGPLHVSEATQVLVITEAMPQVGSRSVHCMQDSLQFHRTE